MKKILKILFFASFITTIVIVDNDAKAQGISVSLSVFQNSLSPYGRWVNNARYGQVWMVNDPNFIPYQTGGHWAYTDYGWTWVSDYNWGWAPFHYGRWDYVDGTGWYWVPGYDWAPAWVAWRGGGDYYGWAPLSPGLTISVDNSWGNQIPENRWVFAPHQYITNPNIGRYYVPRTQNITIIKNTTIVNNVNVRNNVRYVGGPQRADVERVNHTKIQEYKISNASKPGKTVINNNTVNVYRPVINKTTINNNQQIINKSATVNKTSINKTNNNKVIEENNARSHAVQLQKANEQKMNARSQQHEQQQVVRANENARNQQVQNQAIKMRQQHNAVKQQQAQMNQQAQQQNQQQTQMRRQAQQQQAQMKQQQNKMRQHQNHQQQKQPPQKPEEKRGDKE